MQLNNLNKQTTKAKRRIGRGLGSTMGKTSGRGMKGQKARGKVPYANVGGGLILYKKLPFNRGINRSGGNPKRGKEQILISLDKLNVFKKGEVVNLNSLIEKKMLTEKTSKRGVKILMKGEVTQALTIELPVSKNVKVAIEKAGGKVVA